MKVLSHYPSCYVQFFFLKKENFFHTNFFSLLTSSVLNKRGDEEVRDMTFKTQKEWMRRKEKIHDMLVMDEERYKLTYMI